MCRPTFPFSSTRASFFCQEQKCDTFLLVVISYFPIPCFPPHYPPPLMATVCDLVKSCVILLLKTHDSVMITTPPYASCLVLIVNVSHCDVQWYLFFRIRYYTLRLAKSDVFTPKLWEAKWIVDEVSCNFQCCNDVIWAKNDHKLREWLKEASIHLKIPIILKSHLATSFGNVRLQERKITT